MSAERPITPEEAKLTVIQFLGQNIGDLKDLDSRIINKTNQLKGINIDPVKIVNSISPSANTQQPQQSYQNQQPAPRPVYQPPQPQLNIDNNILVKIFDKLCDIEKILEKKK